MKILYLVRHGETDPRKDQLPLSKVGKEEGLALGMWLAESAYPRPEIIITSDRLRAVQTAQSIIAGAGMGIGKVADCRSEEMRKNFPLQSLQPEAPYPNNLPRLDLVIDNRVQENNPPEVVEKTPRFKELAGQGKRPSLLCDWLGKKEATVNFAQLVNDHLNVSGTIMIVSHANILQQFLQETLKDKLDLENFCVETPTTSLTVLVRRDNNFLINRLFSVAHKLVGLEKEGK